GRLPLRSLPSRRPNIVHATAPHGIEVAWHRTSHKLGPLNAVPVPDGDTQRPIHGVDGIPDRPSVAFAGAPYRLKSSRTPERAGPARPVPVEDASVAGGPHVVRARAPNRRERLRNPARNVGPRRRGSRGIAVRRGINRSIRHGIAGSSRIAPRQVG